MIPHHTGEFAASDELVGQMCDHGVRAARLTRRRTTATASGARRAGGVSDPVHVESTIRTPARGGTIAYFSDPDGISLELYQARPHHPRSQPRVCATPLAKARAGSGGSCGLSTLRRS